MGEMEQEVKTFVVGYLCDECGRGFMENNGECLYVYPPLYPHECSHCGDKVNFKVKYPQTITRNIP